MRTALLLALIACSSPSKPATTTTTTAPTTNVPASTGPLTEEQFKALHASPTENKAPLHGTQIDLDGTKAYLSVPEGKGPFPGIVVIHEWWGLNENIEHWADRLATAGYAALAVDLYGGVVATTPDDAMKAVKSVDKQKAIGIIKTAFDFLASDSRIMATKRAVIGWCFGGGYSLQAALDIPQLDGAIIYYGQLETDPQKLATIKAKLLGIFGNRDKGIPPEKVAEFDAALKKANVRHEIFQYDAEHAFANPSNPKYDEKSAADAWTHVLAFLDSLKS
ncbi:MAG TPA: dienelactone hydrolase family protein [Kofleriaceae bacterium]|nr:dienelactone hydrolase family protein [Kofleriaceae bacterium]